jgi:parallel beta-helix repeat protein
VPGEGSRSGPVAALPGIRRGVAPVVLLPALILSFLLLSACGDRTASGDDLPEIAVPAEQGKLQEALAGTRGPARLVLAPGEHVLVPSDFTDVSCGNCQDPWETVPGTLGTIIGGRDLHILGDRDDPGRVVIRTGAGYGLFFEGCDGCSLEGVTVTGGVRDPDGRATNGAVVVRDATVRIADCRIRDNVGDSATVASVVVGIAGIVGREGSELTIEGCRIEGNSWDGIALYRGADAVIRNNVVDGIESARGAHMGGGRGVGIGLTWNARAVVEGNLVRNYWKGIGAFVDADAVIRRNVVEDILTWGIAYWAAGEGGVRADIRENAVFRTGACGAMLSGPEEAPDEPGSFAENLLVRTAQDPQWDSGEVYCSQEPIAAHRIPEGFLVRENLLLENRHPGAEAAPEQLDEARFRREARSVLESIGQWEAPRESAFFRAYADGG